MDRPTFEGGHMEAIHCWEGLSRVSTGSGADRLEHRYVNCLFDRLKIDEAIRYSPEHLQRVLQKAHGGVPVARITPSVVANTEVSSNLTFFSLHSGHTYRKFSHGDAQIQRARVYEAAQQGSEPRPQENKVFSVQIGVQVPSFAKPGYYTIRPRISIELEGVDGQIVVKLPDLYVASDRKLQEKLLAVQLATDSSSNLSIAGAVAALHAGEDPMVPVPEIGAKEKFTAGYTSNDRTTENEKFNAMRSKLSGPMLPRGGFMSLMPEEEERVSKREQDVAVPMVALDTLAAAGAMQGPTLAAGHIATVEMIVDDIEFAREAQYKRCRSMGGFRVLGVSDDKSRAPKRFYLESQDESGDSDGENLELCTAYRGRRPVRHHRRRPHRRRPYINSFVWLHKPGGTKDPSWWDAAAEEPTHVSLTLEDHFGGCNDYHSLRVCKIIKKKSHLCLAAGKHVMRQVYRDLYEQWQASPDGSIYASVYEGANYYTHEARRLACWLMQQHRSSEMNDPAIDRLVNGYPAVALNFAMLEMAHHIMVRELPADGKPEIGGSVIATQMRGNTRRWRYTEEVIWCLEAVSVTGECRRAAEAFAYIRNNNHKMARSELIQLEAYLKRSNPTARAGVPEFRRALQAATAGQPSFSARHRELEQRHSEMSYLFGAFSGPKDGRHLNSVQHGLRTILQRVVPQILRGVLHPKPHDVVPPEAAAEAATGRRGIHIYDALMQEAKRAFEMHTSPMLLKGLNRLQHAAIGMCLRRPPVAVIYGPPGTGKTTAVSSLLAHLLAVKPAGRAASPRVLLVSQSNFAVELSLCKALVRLGEAGLADEEVGSLAKTIVRASSADRTPKKSAAELGPVAAHVLKHVSVSGAVPWDRLREARFVATTVDKASSWISSATFDANEAYSTPEQRTLSRNQILSALDFDYVVVDEASQVKLGQLLPLLLSTHMARHATSLRSRERPTRIVGARARPADVRPDRPPPTLVLAGDPRQLGPIMDDPVAQLAGEAVSLIERLVGTGRGSLPSMEVDADKAIRIIRASMKAANDPRDPVKFAREALPVSTEGELASWYRAAALIPELDLATATDPEGASGTLHEGVHLATTRVVRLTHSFRAVPALTALWSEMTYDGAVQAVHFVGKAFDPRARARCEAVQSLLAQLASKTKSFVPRVSVAQLDRIAEDFASQDRRDAGEVPTGKADGEPLGAGKGSGAEGAASASLSSPASASQSETQAVAAAMLHHMAAYWPEVARCVLRALRSQVPRMSGAAARVDEDEGEWTGEQALAMASGASSDPSGGGHGATGRLESGTDVEDDEEFDAAAFVARRKLYQKHAEAELDKVGDVASSRSMDRMQPGLPMLVCAVEGKVNTLSTKSKTNMEEVKVVVDIVARALNAPLQIRADRAAQIQSEHGDRSGPASGAGEDEPEVHDEGDDVCAEGKLTVAVVTPYAGQRMEIVNALNKRLGRKLASRVKVGTVDGVQGTEADLVVLSTVRTGDEGSIGFLNNPRRTNVAISRARFGLALVCDPRALLEDPFWCACVAYGAGLGCMVGMQQSIRMAVRRPGVEIRRWISMVSRADEPGRPYEAVSSDVLEAVLQPRAATRHHGVRGDVDASCASVQVGTGPAAPDPGDASAADPGAGHEEYRGLGL